MYLSRTSRALLSSLRQGDIVKGVPYLKPDAKPKFLCIESKAGVGADRLYKPIEMSKSFSAVVEVCFGSEYCLVLSQCCQLELRSGQCKATNLVLCPLIQLTPERMKKQAEQFEEMRRNPLNQHVDRYFFKSWKKGLDAHLADFSGVFSVSRKFYVELLESRVCSLTDRERVKFKNKLATYFGRPTKEEEDAGLWKS